jgi:hypothetical protein
LFLKNYTSPTEASDTRNFASWKNVLNDNPTNVINRLFSDGFLQEASLDAIRLLQLKSRNELKSLAKERGLGLSGIKETLAKRLVKADREGMAALFCGKVYFECSLKGKILVEKFQEAESQEKKRTEQAAFEALKQGQLKDACLVVAAYEASRVFSRGLGMSWQEYDCNRDLNILEIIFTAQLSRHGNFDQETIRNMRLAAAMLHLWGTNNPSSWLPQTVNDDNLDEESLDLATEVRMILFHALHIIRLREIKDAGILRVEILSSRAGDECFICQTDNGKKYSVDAAPVLPHEGCSCKYGCGCIVIATEK